MKTSFRPSAIASLLGLTILLCLTVLSGRSVADSQTDPYCALYIPPHKTTQRVLEELIHYSRQTPVNAAVIHVKSPAGELLWPSGNPTAIRIDAGSKHPWLQRHVAFLKANHIHTIAKLDLFADHRLAASIPSLSVKNRFTGEPWVDANGLHWTNPGDPRVWDYNIDLARELALMGFDEIQYDYVRFPSDGDLSAIHYPGTTPGFSKSDRIRTFMQKAYNELKPLGVRISADIFGLTAWKKNDFGVGQVLEKMAPYVDVICPMFYPSHFPAGFLGKHTPGDFPEMIMESSMRSMMRRTDRPIRPWIQGFWYRPNQIAAQMDGIASVCKTGWSVWSPTGRYGYAYQAMARRSGITLSRPRFYPSIDELAGRNDQSTRGNETVVNYTCFRKGYSILSLEASASGKRSSYASVQAVLSTLAEGIIDHILARRGVCLSPDAEPYAKRRRVSDLLCADLDKDARRMRPEPIYIDWANACRFTTVDIPEHRLSMVAAAPKPKETKRHAATAAMAPINLAAISESIFGVDLDHPDNARMPMRTQ